MGDSEINVRGGKDTFKMSSMKENAGRREHLGKESADSPLREGAWRKRNGLKSPNPI